jgi:hypothetical protein
MAALPTQQYFFLGHAAPYGASSYNASPGAAPYMVE